MADTTWASRPAHNGKYRAPGFRGIPWDIDSIAARTELEKAGFVLSGTSGAGNAVFRGEDFGFDAEVITEFGRGRGLSHIRVEFEADRAPLAALFAAVRDSLVALHGRTAGARATDMAFWGRIATGTLLLSTDADRTHVTLAYGGPDPETSARLYAALRPERDSAKLEDREYLSYELTERPSTYCPKSAEYRETIHGEYREVRGTVQFKVQLTQYGYVDVLGVAPVDARYGYLRRAANEYLSKCAFSPGRINGQPVRTVMTMSIPFGQ